MSVFWEKWKDLEKTFRRNRNKVMTEIFYIMDITILEEKIWEKKNER